MPNGNCQLAVQYACVLLAELPIKWKSDLSESAQAVPQGRMPVRFLLGKGVLGMKKNRWIALLLITALLLCSTGCVFTNGTDDEDKLKYPMYNPPKPEDMPYYNALLQSIGQELETVIAAMGLQQEDFEETNADGCWYYKEPVKYLGQEFRMLLEYRQEEHVSRVTALRFELEVDGDPETAAETVAALREKLEGYHAPDAYTTDQKVTLEVATEDELTAIFSDSEHPAEMMQQWAQHIDLSEIPIDPLDPEEFNDAAIAFAVSYSDPAGAQRVRISVSFELTRILEDTSQG